MHGVRGTKMRNAKLLCCGLYRPRENGSRERKLPFIKHLPVMQIREAKRGNHGKITCTFWVRRMDFYSSM